MKLGLKIMLRTASNTALADINRKSIGTNHELRAQGHVWHVFVGFNHTCISIFKHGVCM